MQGEVQPFASYKLGALHKGKQLFSQHNMSASTHLLGNPGGAAMHSGLRLALAQDGARLDVQVGACHRPCVLAPLLQLPLPLPAIRAPVPQ